MSRRIHAPHLFIGLVPLDRDEAHHVRNVLRKEPGDEIEVFDDSGKSARGSIVLHGEIVCVQIREILEPEFKGPRITVACAIPKGDRADWLVEKLSELGASLYIPLITERSVVVPGGRNKIERWNRIALESAKQCGRVLTLKIDEPRKFDQVIEKPQGTGWFFSTSPDAQHVAEIAQASPTSDELSLFIGPEGDWTDEESAKATRAGLIHASLGESILRVETAAMAGLVIAQSMFARRKS